MGFDFFHAAFEGFDVFEVVERFVDGCFGDESGLEPFRWLLNDPRVAHAAFIAETPIDEPLDDLKNIEALKSCVETKTHHRDSKTRKTKT